MDELDRSGSFLNMNVIAEAFNVLQSTTQEQSQGRIDGDDVEGRSELMSLTLNDSVTELVIFEETIDAAIAESDESLVVEDFADVENGVFWGKVTEEEIELERKYLIQTGYLIDPKPQLVTKRKRTSITSQPKYLPLLVTKPVSSKYITPFSSGHTVKPTNKFVTPLWTPSGWNCPGSANKSEAKSTMATTASTTNFFTPRSSPSNTNYRLPAMKSSVKLSATNNSKRLTYFPGRPIAKPSVVTSTRRRSSIKPSGIPRQNTYTVLTCQTPKWNIRPLDSSTPFNAH